MVITYGIDLFIHLQRIKIPKDTKVNQKEVMYENYKATKENIVFHQQDGRWLRTNVVREYFKEVCKRAGVPVLSPHALRHTHAVHLLEFGRKYKIRVRETRTRKC